MIDVALPYLRCPVCAEPLERAGTHTLRCLPGHTFDIARQGYVNLTAGGNPHTGDTVEMIADRVAFLAAGHYDFIGAALSEWCPSGFLVDAGTGTGSYLGRVLEAHPESAGLGLDVSKPALRRAARAHPRAGAALADLWRPLPLADAVADVVLNVFAPRNAAEFRRILRPGGRLLVVTPAPDHLAELVGEHGLLRVDPAKESRVAAGLDGLFRPVESAELRRSLDLTGDEVRTLIGMTPSARHDAVPEAPAPATVTAAVRLTCYRATWTP